MALGPWGFGLVGLCGCWPVGLCGCAGLKAFGDLGALVASVVLWDVRTFGDLRGWGLSGIVGVLELLGRCGLCGRW